ncbi:hypothetical protein PPERSA_05098 [Pseudocohnilembus persalinus]|uniref:Transmembrane protein n=1 Tax=Pseudocohnilembus persalinus TaxID=266149 RepID=A0A0V0QX99_PSEPJ|nr:hypothetical protein PPERSA_05098 [Pseudocohnilembus persalinus]|eukprot:KRX06485.1 hypothetical protein PPERSA_05098 [Pseudocohnilembus persalinus]
MKKQIHFSNQGLLIFIISVYFIGQGFDYIIFYSQDNTKIINQGSQLRTLYIPLNLGILTQFANRQKKIWPLDILLGLGYLLWIGWILLSNIMQSYSQVSDYKIAIHMVFVIFHIILGLLLGLQLIIRGFQEKFRLKQQNQIRITSEQEYEEQLLQQLELQKQQEKHQFTVTQFIGLFLTIFQTYLVN